MRELRPREISLPKATQLGYEIIMTTFGCDSEVRTFSLCHTTYSDIRTGHQGTESELQTNNDLFQSHQRMSWKLHSTYRTVVWVQMCTDSHKLWGLQASPPSSSLPAYYLRSFRSKVQPLSWGISLLPVTLFSGCPSQRRASANTFFSAESHNCPFP